MNFTLRLLCSPGFRGQRSPPQRPVLRRSRNEPCSVTSYGARLQASLGHLPGLIQELNSSTLCSVGQVSQPRHQLVRFETCRSSVFCYGVPTENFHRASVFSKLPISALPISWKRWQPSVLRCQNSQHRVWLGGSNSWMCLLHFH